MAWQPVARVTGTAPAPRPWVTEIAEWLIQTYAEALPAEVEAAAVRTTLDSVACALGALDHEASRATETVARALKGPPESSLATGDTSEPAAHRRVGALNAILHNGTLIRALDCNDIFFSDGVGGHPSDNIAVAWAVAEAKGRSGQEYLRCVAVGYELYWRLRQHVFRRSPGYKWDHVSTSGFVAAAMAGLLLHLPRDALAHALAIGGSQAYSLSEIRDGAISMMKALANARVAQGGSLAAMLAASGVTGPAEVLEGRRGLLAALGVAPGAGLLDELTAPVSRWRILDVTMKPFPAVGTSQAAIAATLELALRHRIDPTDVDRVTVHFPDLPVAHEQIANASRLDPRTRESADHSFAFLVAVALEDGDLGQAQYAGERWKRPSTRRLMGRVSYATDARLNAFTSSGYPSVVTIETIAGERLVAEIAYPPGSPSNPLTSEQLEQKLQRLASGHVAADRLRSMHAAVVNLPRLGSMTVVGDQLAGRRFSRPGFSKAGGDNGN